MLGGFQSEFCCAECLLALNTKVLDLKIKYFKLWLYYAWKHQLDATEPKLYIYPWK